MNNPSVIHQIKGFIEFFEAIPREDWNVGSTNQRDTVTGKITHCAVGHLTAHHRRNDAEILISLLRDVMNKEGACPDVNMPLTYITGLNDGRWSTMNKYGSHPKDRMVNALKQCLELASGTS